MSGIYGIDPFFTYTYDEPSYNLSSSCAETFHPSCLMAYLEKNHPKFSQIVKNTKYYVGIFSDLQFRGTLFVPRDDSISEDLLRSMDINFCRRFVEYHMMDGYFPKNVLFTSPYQQLQTKIKGQYLTAAMYELSNKKLTMVLNNASMIESYDNRIQNAFVHVISNPIPLNFFS